MTRKSRTESRGGAEREKPKSAPKKRSVMSSVGKSLALRRSFRAPSSKGRRSRVSSSSGAAGAAGAAAASSAASASGASSLIEPLTGAELEIALQDRDRVMLVDFYATWCGPCVLLQQELEQVAKIMGDAVRIVKVDTDVEQDLSSALGIAGLPTLMFVFPDNSKPALRTEGLLSSAQILRILDEEMNVPVPQGPQLPQ